MKLPPIFCLLFALLVAYQASAVEIASADRIAEASPTAQQLTFFEERVRPVLAEHCYECHSTRAKKLQAGLTIDSRQGLLTGGDSGPSLVPGDLDDSLLIDAVRYESYEMPPKGKLPDKDIQALEQWVRMGAPWPKEDAPDGTAAREVFDLQKRSAEHWVWQPIEAPLVPDVNNGSWPRRDLDHFILSKLEQAGLRPAVDADRTALLRRAYFDVIGLPPTSEQTHDYLQDRRPDAYERMVDDLLESPHFGERWGRHWLDLVRYAESRGHEFDSDAANAHQYRDYVIRALNADVPYDQLVREHLAGDLLTTPRVNADRGFNESILGTGFWFLGEWTHSPVDIRKDESDRFDNMIDVMSKAFLGVTVSCARCHDHKFDAISTADYYALSGFLQSSDYQQVRFESLEHNRRIAGQLAEVDHKFQQLVDDFLSKMNVPIDSPSASPGADTSQYHSSLHTSIIADYATIPESDFLQHGYSFGDRPIHAGEPVLNKTDGKPNISFMQRTAAISHPAWDNLKAISEGRVHQKSAIDALPKSGRTLRTPTFELRSPTVLCRVRGQGHVVACVDSHRLVAGPLHNETVQKIDAKSAWTQLNLERYVGHRLHLEFIPASQQSLEVSVVLQGASPEHKALIETAESASQHAVEHRKHLLDDVLASDAALQEEFDALAADWARARDDLHSQIKHKSRLAMAMHDGTGEDDHILIRGSSSNPGKLVPRRFLTAIAGEQPMAIASGSGRLELAQHFNEASNPLTTRVIVNRIWHYLMGRGIVATTDDFGVLGQRPTHPELLDHLATRFRAEGQSIKGMIRSIMLSRAYRMSSKSSADAVAADPTNRLWHHRPPKRLEGEAIRDALLAISGQLDKQMYGPPVPIHLTPFMDGRGRPAKSGPLNGNDRRSIYIAVRRNFLSPFMLAFDTPAPFSTMGRRNVSNVPAQALILMNHPLVIDLSTKWAQQALELIPPGSSPSAQESRIDWLYWTGFGREPNKQEQQSALNFLAEQSKERGVELQDPTIWADLAHALVNTKEFIFLR